MLITQKQVHGTKGHKSVMFQIMLFHIINHESATHVEELHRNKSCFKAKNKASSFLKSENSVLLHSSHFYIKIMEKDVTCEVRGNGSSPSLELLLSVSPEGCTSCFFFFKKNLYSFYLILVFHFFVV